MTDKYVTVQHLTEIFHRDAKTIRRWVSEDKKIMLNDIYFEPHRDPSGHHLFRLVIIRMQPERSPGHGEG